LRADLLLYPLCGNTSTCYSIWLFRLWESESCRRHVDVSALWEYKQLLQHLAVPLVGTELSNQKE